MLKILNYVFEEDFSERESAIFFINDVDTENPFMSVDCVFLEKEIEDDSIRPIIGIDTINTNVREREKLVGEGKKC